MNVLVAGIEMSELADISRILDHLGCITCVFAGEADIVQALSFARFDAMVVDLDASAPQLISIVRQHRIAALGDTPLPVIGVATRITPFLQGDGIIDHVLPKPPDPIDLHTALNAAGASRLWRPARRDA